MHGHKMVTGGSFPKVNMEDLVCPTACTPQNGSGQVSLSILPTPLHLEYLFNTNCPSVVVVRTRRNLVHCSEKGAGRAGFACKSEVAQCLVGRGVCVHSLCEQES